MNFILPILCIFVFTGLQARAASFDENDPLIVESQLQPHSWSRGQNGQLILKLKLPTGYHVYEDQFKLNVLEPDGFKQGKINLTEVKEWFDKFSKKKRRGFENQSELRVTLEAPPQFQANHQQMKFDLTYQACTDAFCLFPVTKSLAVPIELLDPPLKSEAPLSTEDKSWNENFFSLNQFNRWLSSSWGMALLFAFIAGILTSFTPCIFPMIPITLAILGKDSEKRSRAQNFLLSVCYVNGIALTYAVLGLVAASSGNLFGASLGHPVVLALICLVFLIMSLSMYGLFEIQVPAFLRHKLGRGTKKNGYLGAFISGLLAGIVASPCVGPILVGILAFVATQKNHIFGFILLYTYACGLGLIFLLLGAFTELTRKLPRSGPWMDSVKFILGSLMLGAFYYYLNLLIPERWHDGLLGLGLVVVASIAGAFGPLKGTHVFSRLRKGVLQALLFIGFIYLSISVFDLRPLISGPYTSAENSVSNQWQPYSDELYQSALKSQKPIIIDFYADWCAACHELDRHTFSNDKVQKLTEKFILLRFDATKDSEPLKQLKAKYKIQGLPTVVFYSSSGVWQEAITLTAFEKPEKFMIRLKKILDSY